MPEGEWLPEPVRRIDREIAATREILARQHEDVKETTKRLETLGAERRRLMPSTTDNSADD